MENLADKALNKVAKWRSLFAGWQLGTRTLDDPECNAVRDHREITILLRVESSAAIRILLERGIVTQEEWEAMLTEEALKLDAAYQQRFAGFESTDMGLAVTDIEKAIRTQKGWKP